WVPVGPRRSRRGLAGPSKLGPPARRARVPGGRRGSLGRAATALIVSRGPTRAGGVRQQALQRVSVVGPRIGALVLDRLERAHHGEAPDRAEGDAQPLVEAVGARRIAQQLARVGAEPP